MRKLAILACCLWTAIASPALAANCHQFFRQKVVAYSYAQPVAAYAPPIYYSAGSDIVQESVTRKALRAELPGVLRAELPAIVAQLRQELNAGQQVNAGRPAAAPQGDLGILQSKCARCHTGPDSEGGQLWDITQGRTAEATTAWMEMLGGYAEPPGRMKALVDQIRASGDQAKYLDPFMQQRRVAPPERQPPPDPRPPADGLE